MTVLREELIQAITVVATSTGMTVNECIEEALNILEEENKRYKENIKKQLFKEW